MAKILFHFVMGLLTGGLWWLGLAFYYIVVKH